MGYQLVVSFAEKLPPDPMNKRFENKLHTVFNPIRCFSQQLVEIRLQMYKKSKALTMMNHPEFINIMETKLRI